ncbi:MAG: hypothetical protein DSZ28_09290 [Thiothrix sp.]|nr:MAG: hypothetical protein DSZ28_09290 [Thiothrix sp.]
MKRLLRLLAGLILIVMLLVVGVLVYATATERGLHALLALANKSTPGTLEVQHANGRILGPLDLQNLRYRQDDGLNVVLKSASLRWQPKELFARNLRIGLLRMDGLEIYLPKPSQEEKPTSNESQVLPEIHLPIAIDIENIDLRNIRIYPYQVEKPIEIDQVKLVASAQDDTLHIVQFKFKSPEAQADVSGTVQPVGDYPLDLKLDWQYKHADFGSFLGGGTAKGDLANLNVLHQVEGAVQLEVESELFNLIKQPGWDAKIKIAVNDPGTFSPQLESPITAHLESKGNLDDFSATGKTESEFAQTGPFTFSFKVRGDTQRIQLAEALLKFNDKPAQLVVHGEADIQTLAFDVQGEWDSLAWPMQGDPQFKSPVGSFKAAGLPADYTFELATDVEGSAIPKGRWTLRGGGSDQALHRFNLHGKTLDGSVHASGNVAWKPEVNWQIEIQTSHLNPGVQWPELPGNITAQLQSQGAITADGPQLSAEIAQLSGQFRGQKVRGKGGVKMDGKVLDVLDLNLSHGRTRLTADGHLGDRWDLNWRLDAPDLAQLAPQLAGRVKSVGELSGTPAAPRVALDLDIRKLAIGENQIKRLKGSAQIDVSGAKRSAVNFKGSELLLGGQQWDDFTLTGSGKPKKHDLSVKLNGEVGRLDVALKGGLKNQQWIGQLSRLAARKTDFGDWTLQQPAAIRADKSQASAKPVCLSSKPTLLCLSGNWSAANGAKGALTLDGLEAARFKQFLPEGMELDTVLIGEAKGSLDANGIAQAQADFSLSAGELVVDNNGEPMQVKFDTSTLKASLRDDRASAQVAFDLGKLGTINAEAEMADLKGAQRLSGKLKTQLDDLTLVSSFVPQLQSLEGELHADLALGGTLKIPGITGELQLSDFAAEVPQLAIHVKDTQLAARSDEQGLLKIEGSSHSGEGALSLSGQLDPATQALQLNVKGEQFQVADSRTMRAVISPDLNISMDGQGMKVEGEVLIPQAYFNAKGAGGEGGTVGVSSDVVLVDENGQEPEKDSKGGNLDLHVQIVLGDDIKIDAADFHGELKGKLLVEQTRQSVPRGTGTIEVVNGDFLVYGQQLNMQRGRILFSGGPIDNPSLDMDVARRVEAYNVLAGAKIRGTAQAPQMQLYSEPSMPDASILSYILIGQPPGAKAGSYTLGKYITPDLYVSYGIALFNAISSFNMRYKLTEKLSLKAASGAASSADLIYTIER